MGKQKSIPEGYRTVGEVAAKMGVTVRTLQYYDKTGLLPPSAVSAGGRRLYTDKDVIALHQILSLKSLGFSLGDIKKRLTRIQTPDDFAAVLEKQAESLRKQLQTINEILRQTELLQAEVLQMETVDFKKYADIIVNLQMKNDYYWLIKHFDDQMLDHLRTRFSEADGLQFIQDFNNLTEEILRLQAQGALPQSDEAQAVAEQFWAMITEFTDGDMRLLPQLMEIGRFDGARDDWKKRQQKANDFISAALEVYFDKLGYDPFGGNAHA